jgi:hypothetical protein
MKASSPHPGRHIFGKTQDRCLAVSFYFAREQMNIKMLPILLLHLDGVVEWYTGIFVKESYQGMTVLRMNINALCAVDVTLHFTSISVAKVLCQQVTDLEELAVLGIENAPADADGRDGK